MAGTDPEPDNEIEADPTPSQELSIEKACEEYSDSVKLTLSLVNHQIDDVLIKNFNSLDELSAKIAARSNFLEKNPSFLNCLVYNKRNVKSEHLGEFDKIKVTLEEHSKRIQDKLEEVEKYHSRLFELVILSGRDERVVDEFLKMKGSLKEQEEDFQDCVDERDKGDQLGEVPKVKEESELFATREIEYDKVIIQKNAFSDRAESPCKFQIFPDIPPDVQRGKPQEDLHEKLVQQLVATDSLEGFLKLMNRKPVRRKTKGKKDGDLEQKYTGSLWFFPSKTIKKKSSKNVVASKMMPPKTTRSSNPSGKASTSCNLLVTSSQPCPGNNQERTRKIRQGLGRTKLKCYDLLDDIDHSDLKPIKSEYPRRDNIHPMKLQEAKSYLHRMMQENEKVWKKLLQLKPRHSKTKSQEKKKTIASPRSKQVKNLMDYLTAPEQKILSHIPHSLIVMPVKIIYDKFPTKDNSGAILITDLTKSPEPRRNEGKLFQTKTETKIVSATKSSPFPMERKREMLDQLRGLKLRNDNIQKNIQKAIDVIETKMIDLLSSPTDATNSEAFSAMEEEITSVLSMMNENQAEKDLTEGTTVKKKSTVTFQQREATEEPQLPAVPLEKKETEEAKKSAEKKKPKPKTKLKKAADIEEGERLLGQVDSVIRKIDSIYTKFYDDGKSKKMTKELEKEYCKVIDFFDVSNPITEPPAVPIEDRFYMQSADHYVRARLYHQTTLFRFPQIETVAPPVELGDTPQNHPLEPPGEFVAELGESESGDAPDIRVREAAEPRDENRHDCTLKTFYTLFFSSIFVALNFDYASN